MKASAAETTSLTCKGKGAVPQLNQAQ